MAAAATKPPLLLPEDIVFEILPRLPVKSLNRFRVVSKWWGNLIQSPQFFSAHYSFSSKNKVRPLVMHEHVEPERKTVLSFISISNSNSNSNQNHSNTIDVVADFDVPCFGLDPIGISLLGCCNGVVCLKAYPAKILLWNLATNESKVLPICPDLELPQGYSYRLDATGFGYDSQTHDFKVLKIHPFWDSNFGRDHPNAPRGNRVLLYTSTADSWRRVDCSLNAKLVAFNHPVLCLNGFYHLWAASHNEEDDCLLSFDFTKHVFITTPFPDGSFDQTYHLRARGGTSKFSEINGLVGALYCEDFEAYDRCYDVWVLGELGVKNSWTKLFTIGPIYGYMVSPLGTCNNGEFFFKRFSSELK